MPEVAVLKGNVQLLRQPEIEVLPLFLRLGFSAPERVKQAVAQLFPLPHTLVRQQPQGLSGPWLMGANERTAFRAEVAPATAVFLSVDYRVTGEDDSAPAEIAGFCIENDYYADEYGTSWSMMLEGAKKLGLNAEKIGIGQRAIREKLESGCLVICSMAPGDFTDTGHFIVLRGITSKGKLLVNDPNSTSRSQKKWKLGTVAKQVKAAWAYSYTQ